MVDTTRTRGLVAAQRGQQQQRPDRGGQPAQVSPATLVRQVIDRQSDSFRTVLPSVVDPDRFARLVLTAVKSTPDLMRCFDTTQGQTSVLVAAMQAAAIGLEPNTATQDCWLLPRRNKGVWEGELSIGYRGYLKLARRSGTIKTVFAEVVREADEFSWSRGLEADELHHRPFEGPPDQRGELTHAYAVARYTSGGYSFIVLNRADVEARRAMSDSWKSERGRAYSPWVKWPEAMWRKSALRALVPFMELSADVERMVASDEAQLVLDDDSGEVLALSRSIDDEERHTEQGAGDDSPAGGGDATDGGDGADSHDVGRAETEPAPENDPEAPVPDDTPSASVEPEASGSPVGEGDATDREAVDGEAAGEPSPSPEWPARDDDPPSDELAEEAKAAIAAAKAAGRWDGGLAPALKSEGIPLGVHRQSAPQTRRLIEVWAAMQQEPSDG